MLGKLCQEKVKRAEHNPRKYQSSSLGVPVNTEGIVLMASRTSDAANRPRQSAGQPVPTDELLVWYKTEQSLHSLYEDGTSDMQLEERAGWLVHVRAQPRHDGVYRRFA